MTQEPRPGLGGLPESTGPTAEREGVAIVGMSCMFPGAPDLDSYWRNILNKVDAIADPPPDAFDPDLHYDAEFADTDKVYCKRGGWLASVSFDPLSHNIPPKMVGGEPDQWIALQLARTALEDAGCTELPEEVRRRTAVVLGKGTYLNGGNAIAVQRGLVVGQTLELVKRLNPEYTQEQLELLRQELKRVLPPMGPDIVPGLIPNIIVGRIANRLDLMGPTYTVDAACASSLVAVQLAMRDLLTHECELALVGGSQLWIAVPTLNVFCQLGGVSRKQQIRPFDKDADGTLLGEGIGMLVLKRVGDALHDGDRIYAVISGVGVASDGRGVSVMAPRVEGEELALRRAYEAAGVSANSVELVEAHGTATPVGDVVEVQALTRVFGEREHELPTCALGTVKSMIGHTIPAAGMAGIIKLALSLHHKVLPPTLNCSEPNPKLELEKSKFYINTEPRPWVHGRPEPRRAGINAFGFGGINAHAVLEELATASRDEPRNDGGHPARGGIRLPNHLPPWESEVCILEGDSPAALLEHARQLERALEALAAPEEAATRGGKAFSLADLAYTLNSQLGRSRSAVRLAVVATSLLDLKKKLQQAAYRLSQPNTRQIKAVSGIYFATEPLGREGQIAFLFPGEGSQYPDMLADLCLHFPEVRAAFDRSDGAFVDHPRGFVPSDFIFPRAAFSEVERRVAESRLVAMDGAIESVLTANHAMHLLMRRIGLQADAHLGHSTGEYSAAIAGGILDLATEERFTEFYRALQQWYAEAASQGEVARAVLLAVGADRECVEAIGKEAGGDLYLAIDNCPHQAVLSGARPAIERVRELAGQQGLVCQELPYDRAVHTPLFAPYTARGHRVFAALKVEAPEIPVYSCATAAPYPSDPARIRGLLAEQWSRPVEFRRTIEALYGLGVRVFVEVGARGNLTSFVEDILRGRRFWAAPANVQHRSGITQLNHLVGMLTAHGIELDFASLYEGRDMRLVRWEDHDELSASRPSSSIKLATGWPPLRVSGAVAEELRRKPADRSMLSPDPDPTTNEIVKIFGREYGIEPDTPAGQADEGDGQGTSLDRDLIPPTVPTDLVRAHLLSAGPSPAREPDSVHQQHASGVMAGHLETMDRFLTVQQEIMEAYLLGLGSLEPGATVSPAAPPPATAADVPLDEVERAGALSAATTDAASGAEAESEPRDASPGPGRDDPAQASMRATELPADHGPDRREQFASQLLALVSERTGYPIEMLDRHLDLEADLGIDSIKRVEILGSYRERLADPRAVDLDRLAQQRTLEQILDVLLTPTDAPTAPGSGLMRSPLPAAEGIEGEGCPEDEAIYPLLGTVISRTEDRELLAQRVFDPAEDLYLRDHTLGRTVSKTDPSLPALAVMPLSMSLEILAEAAACVLPGNRVTGLRDVTAYRWLSWGNEPQTLQVIAQLTPGGEDRQRVRVQLRNLTEDGQAEHPPKSPAIEGTVILEAQYPVPPPVPAPKVLDERPSRWEPDRLYTEGMFHGPSWQGVTAIEGTGPGGVRARLKVLPFAGFLRSRDNPRFILDPIVLDAAGQVIGFWSGEHLEAGNIIFPFRLQALDVYGGHRPEGELVACSASVELIGDQLVRSDIDLRDGDGLLWMRLKGWEDKRFDVPDHFRPLVLPLADHPICDEWREPIALFHPDNEIECRRIFTAIPSDTAFWRKVWANHILTRREREHFRRKLVPENRQLEWLGVRTAAKEIVKRLVKGRYGLDLLPADIEIDADERGRPVVSGTWVDQVEAPPLVSLSHTHGWAVALAGWPLSTAHGGSGPRVNAIGVDIEYIRPLDGGLDLAFSEHERQLLAALPQELIQEWTLRCWCAKEAVGKALGSGLNEGPRSLAVVSLDVDQGWVAVQLLGRAATDHAGFASTPLLTRSLRDGELLLAATTCEPAQGIAAQACATDRLGAPDRAVASRRTS